MANSTIKRQLDLTIKLIITLLAEPKINANALAKALGVSAAWVHKMTMLLREAGLDIEYDREQGKYSVGLSDEMKKGILGRYSHRLKRSLTEHGMRNPPIRFVASLERYDVKQFAQYIGTSPSNIANMIAGYKNQQLPEGWVAYQTSEMGKWFIQKMDASRDGQSWRLPDNVKSTATDYRIGTGPRVKPGEKPKHKTCMLDKEPVLAKGLCSFHYYQVRRHPEYMKKFKQQAADMAKKKSA